MSDQAVHVAVRNTALCHHHVFFDVLQARADGACLGGAGRGQARLEHGGVVPRHEHLVSALPPGELLVRGERRPRLGVHMVSGRERWAPDARAGQPGVVALVPAGVVHLDAVRLDVDNGPEVGSPRAGRAAPVQMDEGDEGVEMWRCVKIRRWPGRK